METKIIKDFLKRHLVFQYVFSLGSLYVLLFILFLETGEDAIAGSKVLEFLNIGYFDYGKLALISLLIVMLGLYLIYSYGKEKKYIKLSLVSILTLCIFFGDTAYNGVVFLGEKCSNVESQTTMCVLSNKVSSIYERDYNFAKSNDQVNSSVVLNETCDEVLSNVSNADKIAVPFTCKADIGNYEEPVEVNFTATAKGGFNFGEIHISRNGKTIYSLGGTEKGSEGIIVLWPGETTPHIRFGSFILKDVTFDGFSDIAVLTSPGAYNFGTTYYAYNPGAHTFDSEPLLDVINEKINLEDRTITSFYKGRGLGDLYTTETYKFDNGKYILVKSVTQDSIDFGNLEKGYTRITLELRSGKMVETKREYVSYEEVWGDNNSAR
jgi:hypothetical protein